MWHSRISCHTCGYQSDKFEPLMDLSLEVDSKLTSVGVSLCYMARKEEMRGDTAYSCPVCAKLVEATKQMTLHRTPNCAVITLKRFDENLLKFSDDVVFPRELDLSPFLSPSSVEVEARFGLYGVLYHRGSSPTGGHYFACMKDGHGDWWEFDDSNVSRRPQGPPQEDAYVLLYARSVPAPPLQTVSTRRRDAQPPSPEPSARVASPPPLTKSPPPPYRPPSPAAASPLSPPPIVHSPLSTESVRPTLWRFWEPVPAAFSDSGDSEIAEGRLAPAPRGGGGAGAGARKEARIDTPRTRPGGTNNAAQSHGVAAAAAAVAREVGNGGVSRLVSPAHGGGLVRPPARVPPARAVPVVPPVVRFNPLGFAPSPAYLKAKDIEPRAADAPPAVAWRENKRRRDRGKAIGAAPVTTRKRGRPRKSVEAGSTPTLAGDDDEDLMLAGAGTDEDQAGAPLKRMRGRSGVRRQWTLPEAKFVIQVYYDECEQSLARTVDTLVSRETFSFGGQNGQTKLNRAQVRNFVNKHEEGGGALEAAYGTTAVCFLTPEQLSAARGGRGGKFTKGRSVPRRHAGGR